MTENELDKLSLEMIMNFRTAVTNVLGIDISSFPGGLTDSAIDERIDKQTKELNKLAEANNTLIDEFIIDITRTLQEESIYTDPVCIRSMMTNLFLDPDYPRELMAELLSFALMRLGIHWAMGQNYQPPSSWLNQKFPWTSAVEQ